VTLLSYDPDYLQPPGLHFSEDSVLLALRAPKFLPNGRAADLGCGCGVVGLEALNKALLLGIKKLFFIEKNFIFEKYLAFNIKNSQHLARLTPVWSDWRDLTPDSLGGSLDYIICNPPWFPVKSRMSPNYDRRLQRQELAGDLGDLLKTVSVLLRPGGSCTIAWPGIRQDSLIRLLSRTGDLKLSRADIVTRKGGHLLLASVRKDPGPF
jgi:tRNA1Val (adenine37-N6)-methyltransferase